MTTNTRSHSTRRRVALALVAVAIAVSGLGGLVPGDDAASAATPKVVEKRTTDYLMIPNNGSVNVNSTVLTGGAAGSRWSLVAKATMDVFAGGLYTCKLTASGVGDLDISSFARGAVPNGYGYSTATNIATLDVAPNTSVSVQQLCSHLNPFTATQGGRVEPDATLVVFKLPTALQQSLTSDAADQPADGSTVINGVSFGAKGVFLLGIRFDTYLSLAADTSVSCTITSTISSSETIAEFTVPLTVDRSRKSVTYYTYLDPGPNGVGSARLTCSDGAGGSRARIQNALAWIREATALAGSIGGCDDLISWSKAPLIVSAQRRDGDCGNSGTDRSIRIDPVRPAGTWVALGSSVATDGGAECEISGDPTDTYPGSAPVYDRSLSEDTTVSVLDTFVGNQLTTYRYGFDCGGANVAGGLSFALVKV